MATRTRMNVYFDPELLQQVEMLALRRNVSKSAIVEASVASFLSGDAADRLEAAMTRRLAFSQADLHYMANLCHNCGACLHACQYAPPHDFGVNIPMNWQGQLLSSL